MHNHKDDSANLNILVVCAYCGKIMDVKSGGKEYTISHGCCDECFIKEVEKIDKMNFTHGKKNT
jgi:hypothetical protein